MMVPKAQVAAFILGIVLPTIPSRALPPRSNSAPVYIANQEVSMAGVIQAVETRRGDRLTAGTYLELLTPDGSLEVQLSPAAPRRPAVYGLLAGDRVEVTGCVVIIGGQRVLLARQVRRGSQVFTFRNKLGFPIASRGTNPPAAALRR